MTSVPWPERAVSEVASKDSNALATGPFGSSIGSRFFRSSGVPVIRGGNLSTNPEVRLIDENLVFLAPEKAREFSRSVVRRGDIIFTSWGTINQVGLIDEGATFGEYVISNKQMKVTPDPSVVLPEYLYYQFSGPDKQREITEGSIGTSIPGFNLTRLRSMMVPLPSVEEQKHIVESLSDIDRLVTTLRHLIAKKREIKQGMMQELLTARTRLPGFSTPWIGATFGDVVRIQRGSIMTRAEAGQGRVPVVAGGKSPAGYTDKPNRTGRTITISASGASAGYVALYDEPIFASDCSTIGSTDHYDLDFVYYSLSLKQDDIYRVQTGGAQPHIHARDVYPIALQLPGDVEEQSAIGRVFREADAEIVTLERRLESTRAIKLGMMQELLTGRTRLPVAEEVSV